MGHWPQCLAHWINIADNGDVVALVKKLNPLFKGDIQDIFVHNESRAHDAMSYLTAAETGRAVHMGLTVD